MSAHENLSGAQWHQLPMYKTAHELKTTIEPGDRAHSGGTTTEDMWNQKSQEARRGDAASAYNIALPGSMSFHESIQQKGVQVPVTIGRGLLLDGHHRVQSAYEVNPHSVVPVEHFG